ncbi:Uma2 family endonuclease [Armatimonas sp.]|uniref:Uma2 family endonuclease n=1 Tax=Armatimonas sp. TaxID=1872638 RepID=UPI003750702C
MSALSAEPTFLPLQVERGTQRLLWTRTAIRRLTASGLLDAERYELFEGDLTEKMKNRRHTITLRRVRQALLAFFAEEYLQAEAPVEVAPEDNETSAPEPDLVVLTRPDEDFLDTNPGPADIALLIEVADSTLRRDLGSKARRYAAARIREYWVVDVENRKLHVHREPQTDGWASITVLDETEVASLLAAPHANIPLAELFPAQ